ncbi:MAG: hypothetical protein Q8Q33_02830, partial [Chlamydiota bacterium]|nr:hypothetical protein [Chlamydiota bacterium]
MKIIQENMIRNSAISSVIKYTVLLGWLSLGLNLIAVRPVHAEDAECIVCHQMSDLSRSDGSSGSLFVDAEVFSDSIHAMLGCTGCHADAQTDGDMHPEKLEKVDCSQCHADAYEQYSKSIHGRAHLHGDPNAAVCASCHGKHDIFPSDNKRSHTYKMNIPENCSQCHAEAKGLADKYEIGQKHVIETYSMSLHGKGIFKRGLIGAAVCTDCHGSHLILPHEDPKSTINHNHVAETCHKCHVNIELVHVKVVEEHLWQERSNELPACVDCHAPHKVRREQQKTGLTDADCMACHNKPDLSIKRDGKEHSLYVDQAQLFGSTHAKLTCTMCHTNVFKNEEPPCKHTGKVDCSSCHAQANILFQKSIHGKLLQQGNENAPDCTFCHSTHDILKHTVRTSPINIHNIPDLCAKCHREGKRATKIYTGDQHKIINSYQMSIHGKGLLKGGLIVTAVCTSCHTAHMELPHTDPESTVSREHIGSTCAVCHEGIYEQLEKSIHGSKNNEAKGKLPVCNDCHSSHQINRVDTSNFRNVMLNRCGKCHRELTEAYFDTYHGKVSLLGDEKTAKCSDCHSAHQVLPPSDINSTLSRNNIVSTCAKCHEGAHRQFAGYLTHATHKDPRKYPALFYTFWFMSSLLLGTFAFFFLHTLLWLPRSVREMLKRRKRSVEAGDTVYIKRFVSYHRVTHLMVILSFLSLAITGMMLKFSYTGWAKMLSNALGGFEIAGLIHRFAALMTFAYFLMHMIYLVRDKRHSHLSWRQYIFHPESACLNWRDFKEFFQTLKWFLGRGPRPEYGRYTYWEKF